MTDVDKQRDYLVSLYPGRNWKERVRKMSDAQVTAIYLRRKQGEETLKEKPKESKPDDPTLF